MTSSKYILNENETLLDIVEYSDQRVELLAHISNLWRMPIPTHGTKFNESSKRHDSAVVRWFSGTIHSLRAPEQALRYRNKMGYLWDERFSYPEEQVKVVPIWVCISIAPKCSLCKI